MFYSVAVLKAKSNRIILPRVWTLDSCVKQACLFHCCDSLKFVRSYRETVTPYRNYKVLLKSSYLFVASKHIFKNDAGFE